MFAVAALALMPQIGLPEQAAGLYEKAKTGRYFATCAKLQPTLLPTTDGRTFALVWRSVPKPTKWVVSLHGSRGFATDDLAIWSGQVESRELGFVCLQWWLGTGDRMSDYLSPDECYREIGAILDKQGVCAGQAMLHGFSRGSANSFAIMALDAGKGKHFFGLAVASSGGVGVSYPPTRAIVDGTYGERPLAGTRWMTVAGAADPNPNRDGIQGMRAAADWLRAQGANVLESIEDPVEGHGALQRNPANARHVLDVWLKL